MPKPKSFFNNVYHSSLYLFAACLISLCLSCSSVPYIAFDERKNNENEPDKAYLILRDGSRVEFKNYKYKSGIAVKDETIVDGKHFKTKDVKGFYVNNSYYAQFETDYVRRIIKGRINTYVKNVMIQSARASGGTLLENRSIYYLQKGDEGVITQVKSVDVIREFVGDCSKAAGMLDDKNARVAKMSTKDPSYLNSVIDTYNTCKKK